MRRLSSVRLIDKGGRIIPDDLFAKVELERVGKPLTVFHSGVDADFDKPTPRHRIEKPPFYAAWATPVVHDTRAGLRVNAACQVIDMNGEVIPGLYCGGESAGGFSQHGLARAACQGYIAGRAAAAVPVPRS